MISFTWKCQLRDLGQIRERGNRTGMILDTPSGEIFVPLTISEAQTVGGAGVLFRPLNVTITMEIEKEYAP